MDPISAIFVMTVLTGLFVKGVDVATDGLLSAEVGAGIRGAGSYTARDVRARWQRASEKAREVRMQTRQGRAVQGILDDAAAVGRTGWTIGRLLFGEARQFGSGIRSEWRTARDQARSVRTERRGNTAWPVTQWLQERLVRLQETRTKTPNEETEQPNDGPNGASSEPGSAPNATTAADPNEGCLHVAAWVNTPATLAGPGYREPRYCGAEREPGWVLCPEHLKARRADPDYPQDDIDEFRADPDHLGPDSYRPNPTPNGDPNVPLESTVPNENGDVRCGCCAQLHAPPPPGEHCQNCPIPNAPNQPTQTGGSTVPDINSAKAAIAAWEAFSTRWESLASRADAIQGQIDTLTNDAHALHGEVATLADGMGDFAVGGEIDTAASVGEFAEAATSAKERADVLADSIGTAKQAVDSHIDRLHDDLDSSIEAAAGKNADVHAVMQEA